MKIPLECRQGDFSFSFYVETIQLQTPVEDDAHRVALLFYSCTYFISPFFLSLSLVRLLLHATVAIVFGVGGTGVVVVTMCTLPQ